MCGMHLTAFKRDRLVGNQVGVDEMRFPEAQVKAPKN